MPVPDAPPPLAWRLGARGVIGGLGRLLLRPRVTGRERLPASGGAVVAFNHDSYLDVLLAVQPSVRQLRFLGKAELFRVPLLGRALLAGGVVPVRRGAGDTDAFRAAVEICRA